MMIRCPYCLENVAAARTKSNGRDVYVCGNKECGQTIPRDYVENQGARKVVTGLIGFSGHGKTVYVTSLFYLLHYLQNAWDGFYCRPLDNHTIKQFYERRDAFGLGQLPEATPSSFPKPSLFQFKNVPSCGDAFISFYDTAGAVFEDSLLIARHGRFVAQADVVVFLMSIEDIGETWMLEMERLLDIYIQGVYDAMHIDLRKRQHLVVALSKADALQAQLPRGLQDTLAQGRYLDYLVTRRSCDQVVSSLHRSSRAVERWLREQGALGFINKARGSFRSVEFTLVSATGAAPQGDRLAGTVQPTDPKRVLDPFFWLLAKGQRPGLFSRMFGR